mmetsp:Transcript_26266/g.65277  ORF Transcript_26266/g.65277 Transcript_26266/m.65277 type:complete len:183 (-) Transcript_26266:435-983(-)
MQQEQRWTKRENICALTHSPEVTTLVGMHKRHTFPHRPLGTVILSYDTHRIHPTPPQPVDLHCSSSLPSPASPLRSSHTQMYIHTDTRTDTCPPSSLCTHDTCLIIYPRRLHWYTCGAHVICRDRQTDRHPCRVGWIQMDAADKHQQGAGKDEKDMCIDTHTHTPLTRIQTDIGQEEGQLRD